MFVRKPRVQITRNFEDAQVSAGGDASFSATLSAEDGRIKPEFKIVAAELLLYPIIQIWPKNQNFTQQEKIRPKTKLFFGESLVFGRIFCFWVKFCFFGQIWSNFTQKIKILAE